MLLLYFIFVDTFTFEILTAFLIADHSFLRSRASPIVLCLLLVDVACGGAGDHGHGATTAYDAMVVVGYVSLIMAVVTSL